MFPFLIKHKCAGQHGQDLKMTFLVQLCLCYRVITVGVILLIVSLKVIPIPNIAKYIKHGK